MDNLPKIEVGIASYGPQPSEWWHPVMMNLLAENNVTVKIVAITKSMSMMPDDNKNKIIEYSLNELSQYKDRDHQTDVNRNQIAHWFINPKKDKDNLEKAQAEWLLFLDTDTVPPKGFITHLINLKRPFVSGLYFLPKEPFCPIAYRRRKNGLYEPVYNYTLGELIEVDSVGMGCALIHISVFQEIVNNHTVFMNLNNGSLIPIYNKHLVDKHVYSGKKDHAWVANGIMHTPVAEVDWTKENSPWPFFALEYARTEDNFFCELANNVGIKPILDTNIVCEHYKQRATTKEHYDDYRRKQAIKIKARSA